MVTDAELSTVSDTHLKPTHKPEKRLIAHPCSPRSMISWTDEG